MPKFIDEEMMDYDKLPKDKISLTEILSIKSSNVLEWDRQSVDEHDTESKEVTY